MSGDSAAGGARARPRINFSLKKEVAFVVIGSLVGAMTMHASRIYSDALGGAEYATTLLVFARAVGSDHAEVGFALHIAAATLIGVCSGVFMHKVFRANLSKVSRGLAYGVAVGLIVIVAFSVPVSNAVLQHAADEVHGETGAARASGEITAADVLAIHIVWGATTGAVASLLTRRFGANYVCRRCNVEFSKIATLDRHVMYVHKTRSPTLRRIVILGGGYGGVGVLRAVQREFEDDVDVSITVVSEDNFFLSTPLLPEMATGHIEARHIATPIRTFCYRARFYQARVLSADLDAKTVEISIDGHDSPTVLDYDHLVVALGGETNYYGNENIRANALTLKSLEDAVVMRNRVISALERADAEDDERAQAAMVTFVVAGGGFSGVETAGALYDFVAESIEHYYHNIEPSAARIVLVSSSRLLPEVAGLGEYAEERMRKKGIEVITGRKVADVTRSAVVLDDGEQIPCMTAIWTGGVRSRAVVAGSGVEHDENGRIIVDEYLRVAAHPEVLALGDCAHVRDASARRPYAPTAQNAIRQARTAARNVAAAVRRSGRARHFEYTPLGYMATIGQRDAVALIMGIRITGVIAWLLWRQYYLSRLPNAEKRLRVLIDWIIDWYVPSDVTKLGSLRGS